MNQNIENGPVYFRHVSKPSKETFYTCYLSKTEKIQVTLPFSGTHPTFFSTSGEYSSEISGKQNLTGIYDGKDFTLNYICQQEFTEALEDAFRSPLERIGKAEENAQHRSTVPDPYEVEQGLSTFAGFGELTREERLCLKLYNRVESEFSNA